MGGSVFLIRPIHAKSLRGEGGATRPRAQRLVCERRSPYPSCARALCAQLGARARGELEGDGGGPRRGVREPARTRTRERRRGAERPVPPRTVAVAALGRLRAQGGTCSGTSGAADCAAGLGPCMHARARGRGSRGRGVLTRRRSIWSHSCLAITSGKRSSSTLGKPLREAPLAKELLRAPAGMTT